MMLNGHAVGGLTVYCIIEHSLHNIILQASIVFLSCNITVDDLIVGHTVGGLTVYI